VVEVRVRVERGSKMRKRLLWKRIKIKKNTRMRRGSFKRISLALDFLSFSCFGPVSSMIKPSGHTYPQKALPRKKGRRRKKKARSISHLKTPLKREFKAIRGSAKRNAPR
jgi:hypothetical protein